MKKFFVLILLLTNLTCSDTGISVPIVQYTYEYSSTELNMLELINTYRDSMNLNTLTQIEHISYKCHEHNAYMIDNSVMNHDFFYDRSTNIQQVLHATRVGENIAYNYQTNKSALRAWVNSPGHRENLEGTYTNFGISITENTNHRRYITLILVKI
jgi:uncharacterized protein YkwD